MSLAEQQSVDALLGRVTLLGLRARPELNGKHGKAMRFMEDKQRFAVQLDEGGEALLLKAENLQRLEDEPPSASTKKAKKHEPAEAVDRVIDPTTGAAVTMTAQDYGGEGGGGLYRWGQTNFEVMLQTILDNEIKSHDVQFDKTSSHIRISVKDQVLLEGNTFAKIVPEESAFTLEDEPDGDGRRLTVHLTKQRPTAAELHWKCVVVGEPEIDVAKFAEQVQLLPEGTNPSQMFHSATFGGRRTLTPLRPGHADYHAVSSDANTSEDSS